MAKKRRQTKELTFAYAIRSFTGYLEGTGKAKHTINSYRLDLDTFQQFLEKKLGPKPVALKKVTRQDLNQYFDYLKKQNLKPNTRRRKILTVRRMFAYFTKRNKLTQNIGDRLPAPYKSEKVPQVVSYEDLLDKIKKLKTSNELELRNQVLLWLLAESGCLVSEVCTIQFENCRAAHAGGGVTVPRGEIDILGKNERTITVSQELMQKILELKQQSKGSQSVFQGFNKFGPLKSAITPRGVELIVKVYAKRLNLERLTPRMIRHSAIVGWLKQGDTEGDIQTRLGLKSNYAFS